MTAGRSRTFLTLAGLAFALASSGQAQSLILFPGPPPGPPVPLQDAIAGQNYFSGVSTNLSGPTTWSISVGSLPPGVSLTPGQNFANFTGTPTTTGTFVFTVKAIDQTGLTGTQQYSIQVVGLLKITSTVLRPAELGASYTGVLSATGGVPPYSWSLGTISRVGSAGRLIRRAALTAPRGVLPSGLTLSSNGALSGAPTESGTFSFDVTVADSSSSNPQFAGGTITLVVNLPPLINTPSTLPGGVIGVAYSTPLRAGGGTIPYQWSVTAGSLPPGLTLAPDGSLTGTPTQAGTFNFTGTVVDAYGVKVSAPFSLTVATGVIITTQAPLPSAGVGVAYALKFAATTNAPPVTWSIAKGALPSGLTLDPASGAVSGTPTTAGNFPFTIQATDAASNSVTAPFAIIVTQALTITTSSLPDGTIGTAYSQTVAAAGGTPPYQFSVTSGTLPPGISIDASTGAISGTPTQTGTSSITVQVTDAGQQTASQKLTLKIASTLAFTTVSPLPGATGGSAYNQTIAVTGGTTPYTFSIAGGSLPAGITLDPTGKLAGIPTGLGAFHFTVSVTDSKQNTSTKDYDLTVTAPALPPPSVTGVGDTAPPGQQPSFTVALGNPYPLPLDGTMDLTFAPAAGSIDDPAIQFSTGGRSVKFTVPAGATAAVFPNAQISLATGTVAGTITLTMHFQAAGQDVTPNPAPTRVIQIPAAAPVISNVAARKTGTGIEVDVTGFSNTREMVSATFQFQAASGTTLQGSSATITADQLFGTWFSDAASNPFGSQFLYTQPFTISGNANGVASVSVTLTNKQGTSSSASGTVQ